MTEPLLLICTALRIEARAVRRGLPADSDYNSSERVCVIQIGLGPRHAARVAALLPPGLGALAVTGFGGALDSGLHPGDVLVASEVRYGGRVVACPSARLLAGELTRAGLPAQTGPLVTSDHLVTGAERGRLASQGARAVDMESGPLAAMPDAPPFAAVRVVVDTPDSPLLSLATVSSGRIARRALRQIGPVLLRWARAVQFTLPKEMCP